MTKKELVDVTTEALAKKDVKLAKKDVAAVLDALVGSVVAAVAEGDKVQLVGFGTFESHERKARDGKNPRTGKSIKIPACKVPSFKAGAAFKNAVNK